MWICRNKVNSKLLKLNYQIVNIDTQWFGNFLPKHKNLKNIKSDVSNIEKLNLKNIYAVIHLASIANDPMAELDKNLSWETSALNSVRLMEYCKKIKAKKNYLCFIRICLWYQKRKKK